MERRAGHGGHAPPRGYGPEGHATVGGLSLATNGLRFRPSETRFESGQPSDWAFEVVSDGGEVVTGFDEAHGQRGHLIVVRRDLTGFQHLHPTLDPDGTWRAEGLTLSDPGVYRTFLDVVVGGQPTTLGFDLFAPGPMDPAPRPDAARRSAVDRYEVELLTTDLATDMTELTFELRRGDDPVSQLEPYLGALGHLVALREGDLAYLHVHPEETSPDSGRIRFGAQFPTPGRYRLFLQSRPDGELVTTHHDVRIED